MAPPAGLNQQPGKDRLAEPFSQIFVDRQEADWAFDLLRETVKRLGLNGPYDSRFALTLTHRSGKLWLHLNFGGWLVLGFRGPGPTPHRVEMTLLADRVAWDERLAAYPFTPKEAEPEVRSYQLPLEVVRPLTSDLQAAYEATLTFIAAKFQAWKRSPYWKQHQPELVEALFDPARREQLFAGGLEEQELRYERHFTPFYQDISEAGEVYEVSPASDESGTADSDNLSQIYSQATDKPYGAPTKTITVESLDGIKPDFQADLYETMKNYHNKERMLVCLYFMSDLPDEGHHLDEIEKNLRRIFPPSLNDGKEPDDYKNFQASMVRGCFSAETRQVKKGQLASRNRLWEKSARGHWRNSSLGNQLAVEILRREGIEVKIIRETFAEELGGNQSLTLSSDKTEVEFNPAYPLSQLAEESGFDEAELARWVRAIERKGQAILYGPPGTGKTYLAEKLAQHLIGGGDGFWELVQFHPAYAYEDFIQGIRPQSEAGQLSYPLRPGRFLEFCRQARTRQGRCVLIIDEINRANLARVFGELMYLLEYRDRAIPLAGGGRLTIPANVYLIGTMNTADRSIALVDHALRRRFAFLALYPNYELLRRYHQDTGFPVEGLITILKQVNRTIHDPHYAVGVTFFLEKNLAAQLEDIWRMEIEPYLEEYFFDRPDKVADFRWARIAGQVLP